MCSCNVSVVRVKMQAVNYFLGLGVTKIIKLHTKISKRGSRNSFTFAKTMQNLDIDPNVFMCSFDVTSLFTNVPLDETIKICSEALDDQSFQRTCVLN